MLASFLGRFDQAIEQFEAASKCSLSGFYTGWTHTDHGEALLKRNGPGDSIKARELLENTLSEANKLGMTPLAARASALLESAKAQLGRGPAYPGRLTQREVEFLSRVALGKTNREIAGELVLSERTVQRHIANVYGKIHARNRAEATTFFLNHIPPTDQASPTE